MTDAAPSVGSRNEAAERLRDYVGDENGWSGSMSGTFTRDVVKLLDAALAHERRATVERIRRYIKPEPGADANWTAREEYQRVVAILDAAASESEAT